MLEIADQKKLTKLLYDVNQLCKRDDMYAVSNGVVRGKNFVGWFDFPDTEDLTKAQTKKIETLKKIEELSITVDSDLLFQTHRENTKFFEGFDTDSSEILYKGITLKFFPGHTDVTKEAISAKLAIIENDALFEMDLSEEKRDMLKKNVIELIYDDYKAHLPITLFFSKPTSKSELLIYPVLRDDKGVVFDTYIVEKYKSLFFTLLQRVTVINY